jgi:tRNA modification GTPase
MSQALYYALEETIVAIATPVGAGGIGIVRLSGPEALPVLRALWRGAREISEGRPAPRRMYYGQIRDPDQNQVVDEVLAVYMPAPKTYTRQDVVEIHCHGGPAPLRRVLDLCLAQGARAAGPGEYTLRAFLNGRIDLAQAEAVADLVEAKTDAGLRLAVAQLQGRLSDHIRAVRGRLLEALAWVEASIDFDKDEIPPYELDPDLAAACRQLQAMVDGAERGMLYRQGIQTAIVGQPNVGKSSLLNALLRAERAIVTPIPGTTRDTLAETLNLDGIPLVLVDTAGIRQDTRDLAEDLGVERSRTALAQADLALLVVDGSVPLNAEDRRIADLVGDKPAIVVANKVDLVVGQDVHPAGRTDTNSLQDLLPHAPRVDLSALTGEGLETLEQAIVEAVFGGQVVASEATLVSRPRHRDLLQQALERVQATIEARREGLPPDLLSIDLTAAVNALGEITGETVSETLLETIFGRFCIGK